MITISVGVAGFEPTTSCSQSRRDTGLRYTPKIITYTNKTENNELTYINFAESEGFEPSVPL
jgi:hypothetical protein